MAKKRLSKREEERIRTDPQASPTDVARLDRLDQLFHPNCPLEVWCGIAKESAYENVIESPLYGLVTLSEPERWIEVEKYAADSWILGYLTTLSPSQRDSFETDILRYAISCLRIDAKTRVLWHQLLEYRILCLQQAPIPPSFAETISRFRWEAEELKRHPIAGFIQLFLEPFMFSMRVQETYQETVSYLAVMLDIPADTACATIWRLLLPYLPFSKGDAS